MNGLRWWHGRRNLRRARARSQTRRDSTMFLRIAARPARGGTAGTGAGMLEHVVPLRSPSPRMRLFLPLILFFGAGLPLLAGVGCGDERVTPEERLARAAAYDSLLARTPDSVLAAMPPIDSLFLEYEPPSFTPFRPDTTG